MKMMLTIIMRILNADPEFGSFNWTRNKGDSKVNSKLNIYIDTVDEKGYLVYYLSLTKRKAVVGFKMSILLLV
jgi:hypothetical protein